MKRFVWAILSLIVALGLSSCCCLPESKIPDRLVKRIQAGPVQRQPYAVSAEDARQVDVIVQFGGGELDIGRGSADLMQATFIYNQDDLEPIVTYEVQGERGRLYIRHQVDAMQWDRWSEEIRNEWHLRFSDQVPLDMDLDVGASRGELALGGLQIASLDLTTGAADIKVRFDEPNPQSMRDMDVRSGVARLELIGLGNANLEELTFDGGVGSYTFDWSGAWQRSASAHIKAGASNIVLRIPRDIGVRVCPGSLRQGDLGGLIRQDDCYVNERYGKSDITLDVRLDVGLSDLRIRQVDGK